MPRLRAHDRRGRIIHAAREAFARHGVDATSLEQIRRAASASTGSLYHHFPTKAHLVAAVYAGLLREYQAGFVDTLDACVQPHAGVTHAVAFHIRWCVERAGEAAVLFAERVPEGEGAAADDIAAANRDFVAAVHRWWRPHVHYGAVRTLPPEVLLAIWLGPAQELCRLWVAGRTELDPLEAIDELADAAWRSLATHHDQGPTDEHP